MADPRYNYANFNKTGSQERQQFGTGTSEAETNARNQGYKGTFFAPQDYADAGGQNFAKATNVLQSGFSGQGQGDTDRQNSLNSAVMGRLAGLQNNSEQNKNALKTDLEQGFTNQADMLRRSAAGTGAGASLGYGRAAGDLAGQFQNNLAKGLLNVENQGTQELGALGGVGQQLYQQGAMERAAQLGQAQDLANMYTGWSGVEGGRGNVEAANAAQATAARKAAQAGLISTIGNLGTTYAMGGFGGGGLFDKGGAQTGGLSAPTGSPLDYYNSQDPMLAWLKSQGSNG